MTNYKYDMTTLSIYSLDELAEAAELSSRTIRHYIAQDLLPGPATMGRNASYGEEHLNRLKCIKVLREKTGYALVDLRPVLNTLTEEQIADIATGKEHVMAVPVGSSEPGSHESRAPRRRSKQRDVTVAKSREESQREEESDALSYIRSIRAGEHKDISRLGALVRSLEGMTGRRIPRRSKNDWWATVSITPDIELRARGLNEQDIGELERLADLLRHLLMKGAEK